MRYPAVPAHHVLLAGLFSAGLVLAPVATLAKPHKSAHKAVTGPVTPLVVTNLPDASEAAMKILKRGGTVTDAAVAIQAILSFEEPQSSGFGGGGFMLYYDAKTGKTTAYNGREKAPATADGARFLKPDGKPMTYGEAVTSGRATGVPGAMFMLDQAHKDHGKLPWASLFEDPIRISSTGWTVSRRLGRFLSIEFPQKQNPALQTYFSKSPGVYYKTGDTMKNPAFAATLKTFAQKRTDAFRTGPLAEAIVAEVNSGPLPGGMALSDLQAYQPKLSDPTCATYRTYLVCTPPPPSGGLSVLQALKIAEQFPLKDWGKDDPRSWALIIEAERLVYADRNQYMADPDFVPMPTGFLDPGYIAARAATIKVGTPSPKPTYGTPPGAPKFVDDKTIEPGGTTHFVIIDSYGNVLSMTTTVESLFGSGRMVGGFFLNNQLTDFSWTPVSADGKKAANAVEPGKRPRSAMSPVMIFDPSGKLYATIGSPGGPSIISYNFKAIIGMIDFDLSAQDAINLPNVVVRGDAIRFETNQTPPAFMAGLKAMGYTLTEVTSEDEDSGLNGFKRDKNGVMVGGGDPRRYAVVLTGKDLAGK
jgi:gamma-glutamyltranspeptidase / glutathione hydrolase